jgi:hypothetical protein
MIEQVLRAILPILECLEIPYMITGGIAATVHGRPRFTQDIDIVIAPTEFQLSQLIELLDPDFVVSRYAARDAYTRHGDFNAIHRTLIFKVDFWFWTGSAFDNSHLGRAQTIEIASGLAAKVATPVVALCRLHGVEKLWSADRDFGHIPGLSVRNPLPRTPGHVLPSALPMGVQSRVPG